MKNIAIFASGAGTNAANIIDNVADCPDIKVVRVYCNVAGAGVISEAVRRNIPVVVIDRVALNSPDGVLNRLLADETDMIVLAGFLWLMPEVITEPFTGRMINIHPSLLPAYGGKGMFGMNVHRAVIEAGETQSGITIHYVNGRYDDGDIIFQTECPVMPDDTPQQLAARIHELEYRHFPEVIIGLLRQ